MGCAGKEVDGGWLSGFRVEEWKREKGKEGGEKLF